MNTSSPTVKPITQALSLCAALFAASLATPEAGAVDITGLIKVNGTEMPGVLIGIYDCKDGAFLGATHTGATDTSSGTPLNYAISAPVDDVRLELYYHPTPDQVPLADQCRDFVLCGQIIPVNGKATVNVDMTCDFSSPDKGCVRSPGYWKNHPDNWPVEEITLGGRTLTKLQAIMLMRLPERGDKSKNVFRHLIAAKLNVLAGADDSCVAEAIEAADTWLANFPVCSRVRASSAPWRRISAVIAHLDAYNNGQLCVPHCGENGDDDKDIK
jgi:hypothetical protein